LEVEFWRSGLGVLVLEVWFWRSVLGGLVLEVCFRRSGFGGLVRPHGDQRRCFHINRVGDLAKNALTKYNSSPFHPNAHHKASARHRRLAGTSQRIEGNRYLWIWTHYLGASFWKRESGKLLALSWPSLGVSIVFCYLLFLLSDFQVTQAWASPLKHQRVMDCGNTSWRMLPQRSLLSFLSPIWYLCRAR